MVIFQTPNLSLILALLGFAISKFSTGIIQTLGTTVFTVAIIIWAYQEISSGANLFRKILGAVVLVVVTYSLFMELR